MIRRIHFAILVLLIPASALCVRAQSVTGSQSATGEKTSPPPLEVTLGYNAVRGSGSTGACACFWMQGGKAEFSAAFTRSFSVVGELVVEHVDNINSANEGLGLVSYLFGPRYSYRKYRRFTPFGQVLIGGVHGFDAYFPNQYGSTTVPNAFAMAAGGGLNIAVSHHLAIRPVQADYFRTQLPNDETNRENSLRLGAGIVIMIGPTK
jgi:outer membrane immunogenic protein